MFDFSVFNIKDEVEPLSKDYTVIVNGKNVPVYTCRISKFPFNRLFDGRQRDINQSEIVSFVNIVGNEELDFIIKTVLQYKKAILKPYSKNIPLKQDGDEILFSIKQNGFYVLELDDYHNLLYIFYNKYLPCENREEVTYYFDKGVHFGKNIVLKDNDVVYVDKDAMVYGNIFGENVKNIRIYGNGIFNDSEEERHEEDCYAPYTVGNIKFYDSKNIKIQGVGFTNSAIWCVNLFHCFDVEIEGIKVFGQWRYNTDGIDIVNSHNVFINNSFIHSFDDTITIKGIDRYQDTNNENIHINNCVMWCDWGKTCEIGLETACKEYKNISFKNIDILRAGNTACDIQNGDWAEVHDIVFENINVEYNVFDTLELYQGSDDMEYTNFDKIAAPNIINIVNEQFRLNPMYASMFSNVRVPVGGKEACVHDISAKNINVYYDEEIPYKDGKPNAYIYVNSTMEGVRFYNIFLENICINGRRLNEKTALLYLNNVDNFSIK